MIKSMMATLMLSLSFQALSCSGFAPENDLSIPVGDSKANSMTEAQYNQVLDRIEKSILPLFEKWGATLYRPTME